MTLNPEDRTQAQRRAHFEKDALPHLHTLRGNARRLTGTDADADDLVQDTMVRAYRYYDRFEPDSNFKGWLLRVQRNVFVNRYRRKQRERTLMTEATARSIHNTSISHATIRDGTTATKNVERPMLARAIHDALETLPEAARSIVVRADIDGWSYKEIAAELGAPIGTVMSRLHRARKTLQVALHPHAARLGIVPPLEEAA